MNDEALERLEMKIAFLEQSNQELSDAVYRQQQDIVALKERLGLLASQFETFKSQPREYTLEEEKPPHY